jgi:dipeptidyl-peptidase-4
LKLTIEDVARFPRPGMAIPGKIAFSPDGRTLTYLWSPRGDLTRELWGLDLETGERARVFGTEDAGGGATEKNVSREEALRRERERLRETGITHYEWAREAPVLLVPVRGELFVRRDGRVRSVAGGAIDARLSFQGDHVAYVRGGDLWVAGTLGEPASGRAFGTFGAGAPRDGERRLTHDAEPGVTNGLAEYMAQEEMQRSRGFWFSRDGKWLAFEQADERHIPLFRIAHFAKGPAEFEEHRYPFVGGANARVRLGVVPVAGGDVRWLELDGFEYLARVDWSHGGEVLVQLQSRDQRRLELRSYDPATGAHRTLLVEESRSWVNLANDLRPLESGELVWSSERTGFRHIYIARDGELRALTRGEWQVDHVLGVDDSSVFFSATREGPLERHAYRVPLAGGEPELLTRGPGLHDVVVSKDGSWFVDTHDSRSSAPSITVHRSDARPSRTLHQNERVDLPEPELLTFRSRDGVPLHAALYRPAGVRRPLSLVVCVYGGPHVQTVLESWALTVDMRAQYLASRGFAVLKVDNRGSARRGVAFESAIHRRMGTIEVDDQVDGVRHAVSIGAADPARVGVYGWSYGGYMTLLCLARAPEVFRVGVAGAPVTEWESYDTHYTERYMETSASNPEGYLESSVLTHASRISGKLLLVHGMIDENVHFRHSTRLLDVLVKAGKAPDLLFFPDERHMPRGERDRVSLEASIVDYFEKNL